MPFEFIRCSLPEVILIETQLFSDTRGFFTEEYKRSDFIAQGISDTFAQDNHSYSYSNVLRGLHFQLPPFAQAKLVRVVKGAIWDVAVDIRRSSPNFGKWVAEELSAENRKMLYIPEGFAHGFCVLGKEAELMYKCSREFSSAHNAGIRWDDPDIAVGWPITTPIISEQDARLPLFRDAKVFD